MTKPVIVKRQTKGEPLTYAELDQNFQNLDDATITVTGDTGTIINNLNDSFKISGGVGLTSSVSGTTLTVNLDNTAVTAGSYTSANITVDAQGRITAASSGSGGVSTGVVNRLSYYDTTTSVNDSTIKYDYDSGLLVDILQGTGNTFQLKSTSGASYVAMNNTDITLKATSVGITNGTDGLVVNGKTTTAHNYKSLAADGTPALDVTGSTVGSYANNATVDFSNFSGMILANNHNTGNIALWIVGGGTTVKISDTVGNSSGTITSQPSVNGYRWTNNTGGTISASFAAIRTRTAG